MNERDEFEIAPGEKYRYESPFGISNEVDAKGTLSFGIEIEDESGHDIAVKGEYGRNNIGCSIRVISHLPSE